MRTTKLNRDKAVFLTKVAEEAERYDEMVQHISAVSRLPVELSMEERNLLSAAYKNAVGIRRTAWRIGTHAEAREKATGKKKQAEYANEYRAIIAKEVRNLCDAILRLLSDHLIIMASSSESTIFYVKMKADYFRCMSEFCDGDAKARAME